MAHLDCQILTVPPLGSPAEVIAETHKKIEELTKGGWQLIGHTKELNAIWVKAKPLVLWRVENVDKSAMTDSGHPEAYVLAGDADEADGQARVAWRHEAYGHTLKPVEIDMHDNTNFGCFYTNP